ncbi:hypothetical protein [Caloranaerobacter ferrireducens]|uniref:hypothetical protein n=1 Tax=Caloranaerobacter ferrireducens TaxID=1323370 RepID=UPI00084D355F|nr:hypothetical protein [Caloranaerobacter ferrireducens]
MIKDLKKIWSYKKLNNVGISFFLIYTILIILANLIGQRIFFILIQNYKSNYYLIYNSTIYIYIAISFIFIGNDILKFINSGEFLFLRSIGFKEEQLVLISLLKEKAAFAIISSLYIVLNFKKGIGIFSNIMASLFFFLIIFGLVWLYYINRSKMLIKIKNVVIFIFIIFLIKYLWIDFKYLTVLDTKKIIIDGFYKIGRIKELQTLKRFLFDLNIMQIGLFLIVVFNTIFWCRKKYIQQFYISRNRFKLYKIKSTDEFIYKKFNKHNNKIIEFVLKDILILTQRLDYKIVQLIFILIFTVIIINVNKVDFIKNLILMFIYIFFNMLFSQELYKIESENLNLYKMLPIKYRTFINSKICSLVVLTCWMPIIFLIIETLTGKISIVHFIISIISIFIISFIIAVYYCSILSFFYPNIHHKTDIPMLLSTILIIFFPIIIFVVVYVGMKKGKNNWYKVEE